MLLELKAASASLFAENHNPSILSPEWIQRSHVIDEVPEDFVHTPALSVYRSATFELTADAGRVEMSLRIVSASNLEALQRSLSTYVRVLPHVPYQTIDVKPKWVARLESESPLALLDKLRSLQAESLKRAFPEGKTVLGLSIHNRIGDNRYLYASLEPDLNDEAVLEIAFHHHFHVASSDEALHVLEALSDSVADSERRIRDLLAA